MSYLDGAQARCVVTVAPARRKKADLSDQSMNRVVEAQRRVQEAINGLGLHRLQDAPANPKMSAMHEAARSFHESPGMLAIQEYMKSPGMQAALEIQNSPVM